MPINYPLKICILGGGFGGLYTALYLNKLPEFQTKKCEIVLIEQRDHFLFTPLLYELLTGELQRWEIAPSYQKLLHNTKINFCQEKAQKTDLKMRQVTLNNSAILNYDYLVLAIGTENRWVEVPGLKTHALTFRTLEDVKILQGKLRLLEGSPRQHLRLAIIGGGPNGVELAGKLADRLGKRGQVWLVERGEQILAGFSAGVRQASYRALGRRGVQIMLGTDVKEITATSFTLLRQGETVTLPIDLVIWAAGTQTREWIRQLECEKNSEGKLLTRPTLQLLSYPEVFALGDLAEVRNGKKLVPATAQAAYQQAKSTANNLRAIIRGQRLQTFRYLHLGDMLALGKEVAIVSSFGLNLEGKLAGFVRRLAYIFRLPTPRHRWQVFKNFLKIMNYKS
jgi:NADH:ubiquinone reductase (non-electrogenic)